jgi:hypothetical protein
MVEREKDMTTRVSMRFAMKKRSNKGKINHAERIPAFADGTCKACTQTRSAHLRHPILPSWSTGHKTITTKRLTVTNGFSSNLCHLGMPSVQTHQISLLGVSASEDMLIKNFASYVSILVSPAAVAKFRRRIAAAASKPPLRAIVATPV